MNLTCGFLAILIGDLFWSPALIIIGLIADVFDGAAARALNAQSDFGKELDSLADMVTFGVAPAFLYFQLSPFDNWLQYAPASLFVAAGAIRLAKFNTLEPSKHFIGLAIPSAAGFIIGLCWTIHFQSEWIQQLLQNPIVYFLIPIVLGALMLSKIEMFSLKGLSNGFKANLFLYLTVLSFVISLIIVPKHSIWITVLSYVLFSIARNALGHKLSEK